MREQILTEIRRLAEATGGQPPGKGTFERETGISEGAWLGVHWARWGDAVREAGFEPNTVPDRIEEDSLFMSLVAACRHFGKMPTNPEMRMYRRRPNMNFPSTTTIQKRYRSRESLISCFRDWLLQKTEYSDVLAILPVVGATEQYMRTDKRNEGSVYLIQAGAHYKLGRSDELERRVKEIKVALPEAATLVHTIRTDDAPGIEAYWHRRFADRRANGEWFKLTTADVAAFKRRKFQ